MKTQYTNIFDFDRGFIGFEDVFKRLENRATTLPKSMLGYPPYNIRKVDDNGYVIELAVAGFCKYDLEVILEDSVLKITGNAKSQIGWPSDDFLFKGIAERPFTRSFTLADTVEIKSADLVNGMLRIWLKNIIPESKKPRKININDKNDTKSHRSKEFLTEDQ